MFMKSSFFKQFRKDSNCLQSGEVRDAENVRIPPKQPLLWGGLDDSDNNASCDLDEDDDYFSSDTFMMNANNDERLRINNNKVANKWRKSNDEISLKAQQREESPSERPFRKINLLFDKKGVSNNKEDTRSPLLKSVESDVSRSPPPSLGNPCEAQASPMLNFLKKKSFEEKQHSPDTRTISSSFSPTVMNNISDVSSSEYFNKDSNNTHTDSDLMESIDSNQFEESYIPPTDNLIKPTEKLNFLYQSLKDEATRMKRIKSQTEFQLNNKSSELQKAEEMVEKLRKSNLELQMSLENVSLKYKDEIENRRKASESLDELTQKIQDISTRLRHFENLANEILEKNGHNTVVTSTLKKLYEKLIEEFKCYKNAHTTARSVGEKKLCDIEGEVATLKATIVSYQQKNDGLAEELAATREQFQSEFIRFLSEIDQLSTENAELRVVIETKNEHAEHQTKCIEEQNLKIDKLEETFRAIDLHLEETKIQLKTKETENEQLKGEISSLKDGIQEIQKLNTEQRTILENETMHHKEALQQVVQITSELEDLKMNNVEQRNKMINSLDQLLKQLKFLNEACRELKIPFQNFYHQTGQVQDELLLHKEVSDINGQNLIIQAKEIEKLKNQASNSYELLEEAKKTLEKLKIANQELKIENEFKSNKLMKVEQQLTSERSKVIELSNNIDNLKAEYNEVMRKLENLQESESSIKHELEQLEICNKEIQRERDQYKASIEDSKTKFDEMEKKMARFQEDAERANDEIKRLNTRSSTYDKAIETGSLKLAQQNQVISDLTLQLEYARQELATQKVKEKSLQEQINKKDQEKSETNKNHERILAEILKKNEKQEKELRHVLNEKDKEIQSLQTELDSKKNDSMKGNKRMEKKLTDAISQSEKLREQLKELSLDKKELTKKLAVAEQQIINLEKEMNRKVEQNEEQVQKHELILKKLESLEAQNSEQKEKIAKSEQELVRLQKIEREYRDFQHQVYTNSPPASTQIPAEIGTKITQTPKSPALSVRLNSMAITKTPQKTPRSILKQPGSASKRRRVFFATESEETLAESSLILTPVQSDEDSDGFRDSRLASPCFINTPKPSVRQIQSPERISNIRKTPSKNGPKLTELKAKKTVGKASVDWFECDQLFGVALED